MKLVKKTDGGIQALSLKSLVAELSTKQRKLRKTALKIKDLAPFLHMGDDVIERFETLFTLDQIAEAYMFMSELDYDTCLDFGDYESYVPNIGHAERIGRKFRDNRVKRAKNHAICTTFGPETAYFLNREHAEKFKAKLDILDLDFKNKFIILSDTDDHVLFNQIDEDGSLRATLIKSKMIADAQRKKNQLYKRACDLCHKQIVAFFSADVPFPVYCKECWWSDKWDPADYGRGYDFNRPFFDQFYDLMMVVPKAATLQLQNENCPYNALLAFSKNTHMSPGSHLVEDCYYVRKSQNCKDCVNSNSLDRCELVAYSTNCNNCYGSHHLTNCRNCSSSAYLIDCVACKDCFMCGGLRNKQYCYKNQQYSKEEYERIVAEAMQKNPDVLDREFDEFVLGLPRRAQNLINCENSSGDYLYNSKNAQFCFDSFDIQDSKYIFECAEVKDSMDLNMHDKEVELCYELSSGGEKSYMTKFSFCTCASPHSEYCFSCFYLSNGFGCDGFHSRKKNYILNKAYSPEDYDAMRAKIIEHMKSTGEYGEFFPIRYSPYAYNESMAQEYFPITKEEALARGYRWRDIETELKYSGGQEVMSCKECQKPYRVISQEKALYEKMKLKDPEHCPDCRRRALFARKNERQLWDRNCAKCGTSIQTSFAPDRPEKVYCEQCYLAEVY